MRNLQRLKNIARAFGGAIIRVSADQFDRTPDLEQAPFTHQRLGVQWKQKKIFYVDANIPWPNVLHEMGHVFASLKAPSKSPYEFDFFGWEYAVAQYIKADMRAFYFANRDYAVDHNGTELRMLTPKQRLSMFRERVEYARSLGLVMADGQPLQLR